MKLKRRIFIFLLVIVLTIIGCCNRQIKKPIENEENKEIYLSDGKGIYILIDTDMIDSEKIKTEICNGNASTIKEEYEKINKRDKLEEFIAVRNILGIAECYLGEYEKAYQSFLDAIKIIEEEELSNSNYFKAVLYNNAGAISLNLSNFAVEDENLKKAEESCEDSYMKLIIRINQESRVKTLSTKKEFDEMIAQCKKLMRMEKEIKNSSQFVTFLGARYVGVGYMMQGKEREGIKILGQYLSLVPETAEYYMVKAQLLGQRGQCYTRIGNYAEGMEDIRIAIELTEKTVNKCSKELAYEYVRMAGCYAGQEEWSKALYYLEKALPGYKQATSGDKEVLYYNIGYACERLGNYEKAEEYFFKTYVETQKIIENTGEIVGEGYDSYIVSHLYDLYILKNGMRAYIGEEGVKIQEKKDKEKISIDQWMKEGIKKAETDDDNE